MAPSNLDHAITALDLIRRAQRAIDTALRLPTEDRAAVAEQIEAVRQSAGDVATALTATVPGAQSLASAGQALGGGLATRPELRALGGIVSFFAAEGSQALGAVAGAAASLGGERDQSLALSQRITDRLAEVGVATRGELARELEVDPRSADFRDALERTLGTGHAEWYGSGTYGLPRAQLETMIARARAVSEDTGLDGPGAPGAEAAEAPPHEQGQARPDEASPAEQVEPTPESGYDLGTAVAELRNSVDGLRTAVAKRTGA